MSYPNQPYEPRMADLGDVDDSPPISTTTPTPAPKKKRHPVLLTLVAGSLFGLGTLVGSLGASGDIPKADVPAGKTAATAQPATVATTPAAPVAVKPSVKDFKLAVKVLEKECFGSAGCNVTFRIDPSWTTPMPPDKTYEVVYEVRGGEEPYANRFTVTGDMATYDKDEMIQIKTSKAVLTAVVTQINEM